MLGPVRDFYTSAGLEWVGGRLETCQELGFLIPISSVLLLTLWLFQQHCFALAFALTWNRKYIP